MTPAVKSLRMVVSPLLFSGLSSPVNPLSLAQLAQEANGANTLQLAKKRNNRHQINSVIIYLIYIKQN
jgi:hypothetical protein